MQSTLPEIMDVLQKSSQFHYLCFIMVVNLSLSVKGRLCQGVKRLRCLNYVCIKLTTLYCLLTNLKSCRIVRLSILNQNTLGFISPEVSSEFFFHIFQENKII